MYFTKRRINANICNYLFSAKYTEGFIQLKITFPQKNRFKDLIIYLCINYFLRLLFTIMNGETKKAIT